MFRLALKNISRNKRRSIITVTSIIFASLLISGMRFLTYGTHQESILGAIEVSSGYIQISALGWLQSKTIERALDVDDSLLNKLNMADVKSVSKRILSGALAAHKKNSRFISVWAADWQAEQAITSIYKKVKQGSFINNADRGKACIGYRLAARLNAEIGSTISIVTSQFDGSVGAMLVQVKCIYKSYDIELDLSRVLISLTDGVQLFGLNFDGKQRYTSIAIGVEDYQLAEKVYEKLKYMLPTPILAEKLSPEDSEIFVPVVHFWPELIPGIVQLMEVDQIGAEFMFAFLILIMAFSVLNTVQMSIRERYHEFGVLLAIGTRTSYLFSMLFIEVVTLLFIGCTIGISLGVGLGYYFHYNPIHIGGELANVYNEMGMIPIMRTIVNFKELYIGVLSLVLPSLLFSLMAINKITKINIVDAINVD